VSLHVNMTAHFSSSLCTSVTVCVRIDCSCSENEFGNREWQPRVRATEVSSPLQRRVTGLGLNVRQRTRRGCWRTKTDAKRECDVIVIRTDDWNCWLRMDCNIVIQTELQYYRMVTVIHSPLLH